MFLFVRADARSMGASSSVPSHAGDSIEQYDPSKKVVCLLHGMGSCQIEAKITKAARLGEHRKGFHLVYASAEGFSEENRETTLAALALAERKKWFNPNHKGVHVRVVPGLEGIATLNPESRNPVSHWKKLIDDLAGDFNLLALNYDWRQWGEKAFAEEYLIAFKTAIESVVAKTGQPVDMVGHSLGCVVGQYCMSKLGPSWQEAHVSKCIWVAPSQGGSPSALPNFAGKSAPTPSEFIPVAEVLHEHLALALCTWPCLVAMAPQQVGDEPVGVIATTPTRTYTVENMGSFFTDLADNQETHYNGKIYWPEIRDMWAELRTPVVPVRIIYSNGSRTPASWRYKSEDLTEWPQVVEHKWGDGLVAAETVEALAKGWKVNNPELDIELYRERWGAQHKDFISSGFAVKVVSQIVRGTAPKGQRVDV